jgi:hypothetical protein
LGAQVVGAPPQRRAQVGAADVPDEQRIARQDGMRFCRVLLQIERQDRDGLDSVAGGLKHLEAQARELERIAVLHRHEVVFCLGAGAEMDGCTPFWGTQIAKFQMARDKVGVKMGEKDVADLEAQFLGVSQVLLNIALRVDDDRSRTGLVS